MATNYKRKTSQQKYNVDELSKRFRAAVIGIVSFVVVMFILLRFFGPQIGALFGFISVNRNQTIPQAHVSLSPPSFTELPDATKDKQINIEGYSNPGTTVKLYLNGPEKGEALADAEGKFLFEGITLLEGRNTIFGKAIDEDGNKSERSDTNIVTLDLDEPEITITKPKNGETIKNLNKRISIQGEVNEKAKLKINDRLVVLRPNLSFDYLLGVSEGDVEIRVEATDDAGNVKEEKIFVKYEKTSD